MTSRVVHLLALVEFTETGTTTDRLAALGALDCAAAEGVAGAAALARWIYEHPEGAQTPEEVVRLDVLRTDHPHAS